jgi:hypothetical protein
LQQALFLLLGAEPPNDWFNPDRAIYEWDYRPDYGKAFAQSYKEYFDLAEGAILLKTLMPYSIHEYTAPIHAMKFHPRHILAWAQNKQLNIPEPLAPILNKTSPYPPESTSPESRRAEGKAITSQRNARLQQDADRLAQEHPAWNKGKIA